MLKQSQSFLTIKSEPNGARRNCSSIFFYHIADFNTKTRHSQDYGLAFNSTNKTVKYEESEKLNLSVSAQAKACVKLHTENNNAEARPKAEPERSIRVVFEIRSNFRIRSALRRIRIVDNCTDFENRRGNPTQVRILHPPHFI